MDALKQGIERERAIRRNHDLAVEDEGAGFQLADGFGDLRKIADERLARLRLQLDMIAVAKREAAESVPFRFVLPLRPVRDLADGQGLHRRERRPQCKGHEPRALAAPEINSPS